MEKKRNLVKTRNNIIKKTIELGSRGIINLKTTRIANQLRLAESTIFFHFKTKDNLLLKSYEYIDDFIFKTYVLLDDTLDNNIKNFILYLNDIFKEYPHYLKFLINYRLYLLNQNMKPVNNPLLFKMFESINSSNIEDLINIKVLNILNTLLYIQINNIEIDKISTLVF